MKTRTSTYQRLFCSIIMLLFMGGIAPLRAQQNRVEVINIHLKDGNQLTYTNGILDMDVWDDAHIQGALNMNMINHSNFSYDSETDTWTITTLPYYDLWHPYGTSYNVLLAWQNSPLLPSGYQAGICFGKNPLQDAAHCDTLLVCDHQYEGQAQLPDQYIAIGGMRAVEDWAKDDLWQWHSRYKTDIRTMNWYDYDLQPGETYYYCPFVLFCHGSVAHPDSTFFYAKETQSFRIPKLIADYGRADGDIVLTSKAESAFVEQYADDATVQRLARFSIVSTRWAEFLATDEGKAIDLSKGCVTTCDDGSFTELDEMPESFYQWLVNVKEVPHEVVINDTTGVVPNEAYTTYCILQQVDSVDEIWKVPNNRYIVAEPSSSISLYIAFDFLNVVPGKYKVQITFAPETRYENTEENAAYFAPSKFRIRNFDTRENGDLANGIEEINPEDSSRYFTASATEVSTIEFEHEVVNAGFYLQLQSFVTASERVRNLYSKTLRIAEVRLIPVTED